ncbi:MAG: TldD/PmbA family protein [Candidatus Brockarchaeota archaeon]|nr:TldD/PmbA family protein [Candidatus Brockarchaeota archaeon]
MDALDLCVKGVRLAERLGAGQAEIVASVERSLSISLERSFVRSVDEGLSSSFGVRVYIGKSIGISTSTLLDEDRVEKAVKRAIGLARCTPPDDAFVSLPGEGKPVEVQGLYDDAIAALTSEELVSKVLNGVQALKNVDKTLDASGRAGLSVSEGFIANSLGVERKQKSSRLFFGIEALKKGDNGEIGTGYDYFLTRSIRELRFEEAGENAARKAVKSVGGKGVESGEYALILDERTTLGTLERIVGYGANAFYVLQKSSYYSGKLGSRVASEKLSILDDPLYPSGWASSPFDDEGYPCSRVRIVEKGLLVNYITDSYTANALNIENNGHATRPSLAEKPVPSLTNLQIAPGDYGDEELFKDVKRGIYVYDSSLGPVGGSTNISSLIDHGFLVENGEMKHPVKNTMVGSTVFEILQSVDAVGRRTRNEAGRVAPKIRIRNVRVSS